MSKRWRGKEITCLGGGTGTSMVLSGLKRYPVKLSAIVTMFDNGGSSGKLREELGILPVGDIRQCLVSLSNENNLTNFFHYRFGQGSLRGHNLGNLLIAAAEKMTGSLEKAIVKIEKILNVKGKVIPITLGNSNIKAILKNNEKINGEESIINHKYLSKIGIKKLFLEPKVNANPKAILAIKNADLIIIGPGNFYTSILSNFLVKGIPEVIRKSRAKKVFICNLVTQRGNTDNFGVEDFVAALEKCLGKDIIDYVVFNTGKLPPHLIKEVKKDFPKTDFIKYNKNLIKNKKFIGADVLDRRIRKMNPADVFVKGANRRAMILHDPQKLSRVILSLI